MRGARQNPEPLSLPGLTQEEETYLFGIARRYLYQWRRSRGVWDADDVLQTAYLGVLEARRAYEAKGRKGEYSSYLTRRIRSALVVLARSHCAVSGHQHASNRYKIDVYPIAAEVSAKTTADDEQPAIKLAAVCEQIPEQARAYIGHRYGVLGYPRLFFGSPQTSRENNHLNARACYWMRKLKKLVGC